ncbi:hypothetical protein [Mucilaginibacter sp. 3215]|uniref:hypothetical protein n=1 Tax=Mucilaginibacter sp. 3215 TaxID=3373912 RepID=UPI003D1947A8
MRTYKVELLVSGPITINGHLRFNAEKELVRDNIFQSDIIVQKHPAGAIFTVTVFTIDQDRAYKVALLFIGKMLDILAVRINGPLNVSLNDHRSTTDKNAIRAIVDEGEIRFCFDHSRNLNLHETKLLRALNWYRKGLYTDDAFDKYMGFWNAISVVASGYHQQNDRTRAGIINQIYDCFNMLWGNDQVNWPEIDGTERWIDSHNKLRDQIAHGIIPVDVEHIELVLSRLNKVQKVAYNFITGWAQNRMNINLTQ